MKSLRAGRFQLLTPSEQAQRQLPLTMQKSEKLLYHYEPRSSTNSQAVSKNPSINFNQGTLLKQTSENGGRSAVGFQGANIDISVDMPRPENDIHNQNYVHANNDDIYSLQNGTDHILSPNINSPLKNIIVSKRSSLPSQKQNRELQFSKINEESKEVSTYRIVSPKDSMQARSKGTNIHSQITNQESLHNQIEEDSVNERDSKSNVSDSQRSNHAYLLSDELKSAHSTQNDQQCMRLQLTGLNFLQIMREAQDHFKDEELQDQKLETASSNMDESMLNAYREVVPKSQFEALKEENARLRRETPKLKENLDKYFHFLFSLSQLKLNEVNFLMAGVENAEEIKQGYDKKVQGFEKDIEIVKAKIDKAVLSYTQERIQTQNLDLAFKRII